MSLDNSYFFAFGQDRAYIIKALTSQEDILITASLALGYVFTEWSYHIEWELVDIWPRILFPFLAFLHRHIYTRIENRIQAHRQRHLRAQPPTAKKSSSKSKSRSRLSSPIPKLPTLGYFFSRRLRKSSSSASTSSSPRPGAEKKPEGVGNNSDSASIPASARAAALENDTASTPGRGNGSPNTHTIVDQDAHLEGRTSQPQPDFGARSIPEWAIPTQIPRFAWLYTYQPLNGPEWAYVLARLGSIGAAITSLMVLTIANSGVGEEGSPTQWDIPDRNCSVTRRFRSIFNMFALSGSGAIVMVRALALHKFKRPFEKPILWVLWAALQLMLLIEVVGVGTSSPHDGTRFCVAGTPVYNIPVTVVLLPYFLPLLSSTLCFFLIARYLIAYRSQYPELWRAGWTFRLYLRDSFYYWVLTVVLFLPMVLIYAILQSEFPNTHDYSAALALIVQFRLRITVALNHLLAVLNLAVAFSAGYACRIFVNLRRCLEQDLVAGGGGMGGGGAAGPHVPTAAPTGGGGNGATGYTYGPVATPVPAGVIRSGFAVVRRPSLHTTNGQHVSSYNYNPAVVSAGPNGHAVQYMHLQSPDPNSCASPLTPQQQLQLQQLLFQQQQQFLLMQQQFVNINQRNAACGGGTAGSAQGSNLAVPQQQPTSIERSAAADANATTSQPMFSQISNIYGVQRSMSFSGVAGTSPTSQQPQSPPSAHQPQAQAPHLPPSAVPAAAATAMATAATAVASPLDNVAVAGVIGCGAPGPAGATGTGISSPGPLSNRPSRRALGSMSTSNTPQPPHFQSQPGPTIGGVTTEAGSGPAVCPNQRGSYQMPGIHQKLLPQLTTMQGAAPMPAGPASAGADPSSPTDAVLIQAMNASGIPQHPQNASVHQSQQLQQLTAAQQAGPQGPGAQQSQQQQLLTPMQQYRQQTLLPTYTPYPQQFQQPYTTYYHCANMPQHPRLCVPPPPPPMPERQLVVVQEDWGDTHPDLVFSLNGGLDDDEEEEEQLRLQQQQSNANLETRARGPGPTYNWQTSPNSGYPGQVPPGILLSAAEVVPGTSAPMSTAAMPSIALTPNQQAVSVLTNPFGVTNALAGSAQVGGGHALLPSMMMVASSVPVSTEMPRSLPPTPPPSRRLSVQHQQPASTGGGNRVEEEDEEEDDDDDGSWMDHPSECECDGCCETDTDASDYVRPPAKTNTAGGNGNSNSNRGVASGSAGAAASSSMTAPLGRRRSANSGKGPRGETEASTEKGPRA
ncbi:hypothetical protein OC846_005500 [Tilletia horrida]|uniref:Uncharacterized protein n=1 Tax=Tilletia horrida TaxID=155126 RepID=A0AAN6GLP0_9BASI|nr:hypothetical protein OC846_005500 [Tilletia horrida]KAK0551546.1 hypothetical protein OC845_002126 [Tilletia horrida]KAK0569521.1 hypothetical protein OC861_000894 [Tilletia horrida]